MRDIHFAMCHSRPISQTNPYVASNFFPYKNKNNLQSPQKRKLKLRATFGEIFLWGRKYKIEKSKVEITKKCGQNYLPSTSM